MKKFIALFIPVMMLAVFVLIMISAPYLKQPFGDEDSVSDIIDSICSDMNEGDWIAAGEGVEKLDETWDIVTKRVQFSAERDELRAAKTGIARAKGYIEANDREGSLAELYEVKEHWIDIGR